MDKIKFLKTKVYNFLRKHKKIGVSYNLFDGEELLPFSIKAIRKSVHHISVVYQVVSNFGNPASSDLEEKLTKWKEEGLIDELYLYEPDIKAAPQKNEARKRDIGLKLAKKNGCNYFLSMDTDEFYDSEKFEYAIGKIIKNNIKASAVSIVEYLKSPENQIVGNYTFTPRDLELYNYYVPFIIKINKFMPQHHGKCYFPCYTDPTRQLTHGGRFKVFSVHDVAMHHMSTIRLDLDKKYNNSSSLKSSDEFVEDFKAIQREVLAFDFDNCKILPEDCAIFRKNIVRKVPNKFNIEL